MAVSAESIFNLQLVPGLSETMAHSIFQSGFGSFQSVADAALEDIMTIPGFEDPAKAEVGTIRNRFAKSIEANAVHGSDSNENAEREASFFFNAFERF